MIVAKVVEVVLQFAGVDEFSLHNRIYYRSGDVLKVLEGLSAISGIINSLSLINLRGFMCQLRKFYPTNSPNRRGRGVKPMVLGD